MWRSMILAKWSSFVKSVRKWLHIWNDPNYILRSYNVLSLSCQGYQLRAWVKVGKRYCLGHHGFTKTSCLYFQIILKCFFFLAVKKLCAVYVVFHLWSLFELVIVKYNYSQISISLRCVDYFYKFETPDVQINLHFG